MPLCAPSRGAAATGRETPKVPNSATSTRRNHVAFHVARTWRGWPVERSHFRTWRTGDLLWVLWGVLIQTANWQSISTISPRLRSSGSKARQCRCKLDFARRGVGAGGQPPPPAKLDADLLAEGSYFRVSLKYLAFVGGAIWPKDRSAMASTEEA